MEEVIWDRRWTPCNSKTFRPLAIRGFAGFADFLVWFLEGDEDRESWMFLNNRQEFRPVRTVPVTLDFYVELEGLAFDNEIRCVEPLQVVIEAVPFVADLMPLLLQGR